MRIRILAICCICLIALTTPGFSKDIGQKDSTEYEKLYQSLIHLAADEDQAAVISNFTLTRDAGSFVMGDGLLWLCKPVNGRVVAAFYTGTGMFLMTPPTDIERKQLSRFYEQDSICQPFTTLFLLFADSTLSELRHHLTFTASRIPRTVPDEIENSIRYVSSKDAAYIDTDLMQAFLGGKTDQTFYSHFWKKSNKPFFFQIDPYEEEEVRFGERSPENIDKRREIISQFHTKEQYQRACLDEDKNQIRIVNYQIESTISKNHGMAATANISLISQVDSLLWIPFLLFEDLDVDSVAWSRGGAARFARHKDNPVLWVQAPHPLEKNERLTLTVAYHGELLTSNELGWIGLKSSSEWYPRYGYRMRANFDMIFHTPARWKFAGIGDRMSINQAGDTLTSRWTTLRPAVNASFAIGDFDEVLPEGDNAAVERKEGEFLPNITVYTFASGKKIGDARLENDVRADMLNSMRFFRHVYGDSPVSDFYATEIPFSHGEAFPGLIHLSGITFKLADRYGNNEIFRAHEVAHQWWGVGVGYKTYHDQWLSEGISEYSGIWFMQAVLKDNEKFFKVLDTWRETILTNRHYLLANGQEAGPIWQGRRTQSSQTEGDYDLIIYKKGAWVLHMLRNMMIDLKTMNEDRFKNMMRDFFATYRGKDATTADFQRIVEKHMGGDMGWFFNQWIMDTHIPSYEFAYRTEKSSEGKYKVYCRVKQKNVPVWFRMYVPLLIKFDGGRYVRTRVLVSSEKPEFELPLLPLEPEEIVFNDLNSVLCEVDNTSW